MGINYRWQPYRAGLFGPLPEDLKRDILEIIAYQYPLLAPKLTLVSKDVQRWIEHIIYREIIFTCHRFDSSDPEGDPLSKFKRTIAVRPASFFAEHVKSLHFEGSSFTVDSVLPVLNVCTGVTNFGCYATFTMRRDNQYGAVQDDDDDDNAGNSAEKIGPPKVYEYIQSLALERLFISQENLTELLKTPNPAPGPNGDPMGILRVTHLAVTNGYKVPFSRFPRLTHWALNPENDACVPKVKRILGKASSEEGAENQADDQLNSHQIQSVVVMLNDLRARTTPAAKALREIIDPRLVQFTLPVSSKKFIEDDLWDLAMEFPDEEMPVTYLDWEPTPRIYTFQEAMELGLFEESKPAAKTEGEAPAAEAMAVDAPAA